MAQQTPFDNYAVWTLAGASADGIVYAVSVDPILLDVTLWAFSGARRTWKVLASSSAQPILEDDRHCLVSASYNERLGRVDVFLECHHFSAFLFRFLTRPSARLECVLTASNNQNILFDGTTGPSLHHLGDQLIVVGAMLQEPHQIRIFRIDFDSEKALSAALTLTEVWNEANSDLCLNYATAGDKFMMVTASKLKIFTPAQQWSPPTVFRDSYSSFDSTFPVICASPSAENRFWIMPYADGNIVKELTMDDGQLVECRRLNVAMQNGLCESVGTRKAVVASSSELYWVKDSNEITDEPTQLKVETFSPPALQYLCLRTLCSTIPAIKECKTEDEAKLLKIPVLVWRRYCR